ncbi:MAG TPA: GNAT family N-acetyltransferase [Ktedonobacterales bacterium]
MLTLRPMTAEEYDHYADAMWEDYAHERARNLGTALEQERAVAAQQRAQLVPEGWRTPGQRFWCLLDESGARVGQLWIFLDAEKQQAFLYDIAVDAPSRGRGYGKQALEQLEAHVRPLGVKRIALNVFGDNAVAMHLYRQTGYRTVATSMQKDLGEG